MAFKQPAQPNVKRPRVTLRKRPAQLAWRPQVVAAKRGQVAEEAVRAGQLIFQEDPLVSAQVWRRAEDFAEQQPLFCAQCSAPCGSLLVDLSLAANMIHRPELLNVLRGGDAETLQRWLDFATKRQSLPFEEEEPGIYVLDVPEASPNADLCFCSSTCLKSYLPEMQMEKAAILSAANKLIAMAASKSSGGLRSKDELMLCLKPLLQCVRGRCKLSFSQSMVEGCYRRLVGALAGRVPATKNIAWRALKSLVSLDLYSRIVATLDTRSWSLNGATLPSRLGIYCDKLAAADTVDTLAAKRTAARVLAPVVEDLRQLQEELSEEETESDEHEVKLVVPLPATDEAKKSSVIFWPKLLNDEEIQQILDFSAKMRQKSEAQWSTCYLQAGGVDGSLRPILLKLKDLALHVDAQPGGWNRLHGDLHKKLQSRVVEHHSVTVGGALPDPSHFDGGSLFTIDVMLNTPGLDFQGGDFCTMESDEKLHPHHFGKGDALVFLSHKAHCVQPVTHGVRQTLVMELWEGEERCCNHRCQQRWGPCSFSQGNRAEDDMEMDQIFEEGPRLFAQRAFEGVAFFPKVGQILCQSVRQPKSAGNVEVVFEEAAPKASLRATHAIRKGEMFVLK